LGFFLILISKAVQGKFRITDKFSFPLIINIFSRSEPQTSNDLPAQKNSSWHKKGKDHICWCAEPELPCEYCFYDHRA
jgi:hypothetical protein